MGLPALEPIFKKDMKPTDLQVEDLSLSFDDHVLDRYK